MWFSIGGNMVEISKGTANGKPVFLANKVLRHYELVKSHLRKLYTCELYNDIQHSNGFINK